MELKPAQTLGNAKEPIFRLFFYNLAGDFSFLPLCFFTAHSYTADGLPGPFASPGNLAYNDTIAIHLGGLRYIYAVRSNFLTGANSTS